METIILTVVALGIIPGLVLEAALCGYALKNVFHNILQKLGLIKC